MQTDSMIQLHGITKSFGSLQVLRGIDLQVNRGEVVAIVGPSGAGKTTLLQIMGTLDRPDEGEVIIDGENVSRLSATKIAHFRNKNIGFVFQSFNLIDELNVEENVELPLKALGVPAKERRQRVVEILRQLKMSHRAHHYPQQLSGGQQQRVAIARAVVTKPSLLLADEPTGNLDSRNGLEVMELLSQLNQQGVTIVMVTHSQHDATFAQRTVELFDGQVVDSLDGVF